MDTKGIVYLSGPISGHEDTYHHDFHLAQRLVREAGYTALSPDVLPDGLTQRDYMRISLAMLEAADALVYLKGAMSSIGAQIEVALAKKTGKPVKSLLQFCQENNLLALPEEAERGRHEQTD